MGGDRVRPDVLIRPNGRVEPYERPAAEPPPASRSYAESLPRWVRRAADIGFSDPRLRPWHPRPPRRGRVVDETV